MSDQSSVPVPTRQPPRTLCVDFDGTLCEHTFPGIGAIKPDALVAMNTFKKMGYYIIVWSCRTCRHHEDIFGVCPDDIFTKPCVAEMKAWLDEQKIPYDEIDDGSKGKPLADFYIDDKAIRFENNWLEVVTMVAAEWVGRKAAEAILGDVWQRHQ